jgi:MFS transporter, ACS family, D-galactonate transporter
MSERPRRLYWIGLALLVVSVAINYADRGNLGVANKTLSAELHLSPSRMGYLLGAFSLTYAFAQIFAGKVIDRWNVNWVYALGFLLWSAATGLTGLANSFTQIFALRLLLGISESVAYPCYSKMIVMSFGEQLRGTANALIDVGSKIGPAIGVLLGVKMIEWFSWRGMFLIMGGVSLLWLLPWSFVASKLPHRCIPKPGESAAVPSLRAIVSSRPMWGTAIGLFGGNYVWFFFLNWLPLYFETERHYTHDRLALFGSLPFWAIAVSSLSFGCLADVFVRRGKNAGRVRQSFVCFGLLGCCLFMLPAVLASGEWQANALLFVALVSMGAWSSNHWAFTQYLAGHHAAGKWTGVQNCIGNLAGFVGQVVSGYALAYTHSFFAPFAIACGITFVAILSYWFVVGRPAEVHWDTATAVLPVPVPEPS